MVPTSKTSRCDQELLTQKLSRTSTWHFSLGLCGCTHFMQDQTSPFYSLTKSLHRNGTYSHPTTLYSLLVFFCSVEGTDVTSLRLPPTRRLFTGSFCQFRRAQSPCICPGRSLVHLQCIFDSEPAAFISSWHQTASSWFLCMVPGSFFSRQRVGPLTLIGCTDQVPVELKLVCSAKGTKASPLPSPLLSSLRTALLTTQPPTSTSCALTSKQQTEEQASQSAHNDLFSTCVAHTTHTPALIRSPGSS